MSSSLNPNASVTLTSCRQIRAARALIGWTQKDLGNAIGVDERQIRFWERRLPTNKTKLLTLIDAFKAAGVEFISAPTIGVRGISNA
jgi:transcriptional regulator with XRE-family HTH domain